MPVGEIEKTVLRVMAANRNPDSYVASGTVLHQAPHLPRTSDDVDVFHDAPEALRAAFEADVAALRSAGFDVEFKGRPHDSLQRAGVRKSGHQTRIE